MRRSYQISTLKSQMLWTDDNEVFKPAHQYDIIAILHMPGTRDSWSLSSATDTLTNLFLASKDSDLTRLGMFPIDYGRSPIHAWYFFRWSP